MSPRAIPERVGRPPSTDFARRRGANRVLWSCASTSTVPHLARHPGHPSDPGRWEDVSDTRRAGDPMKQQNIGFRTCFREAPADRTASAGGPCASARAPFGVATEVERAPRCTPSTSSGSRARSSDALRGWASAPSCATSRATSTTSSRCRCRDPRMPRRRPHPARTSLPTQAPASRPGAPPHRLDDRSSSAIAHGHDPAPGCWVSSEQAGRGTARLGRAATSARTTSIEPTEAQPIDASIATDSMEHPTTLFCPTTPRKSASLTVARARSAPLGRGRRRSRRPDGQPLGHIGR